MLAVIMLLLPALGQVPNISLSPLSIKATISGIVFLKQNTFRTRYTGNKYSAVDINGKLFLKKSELEKQKKIEGGGGGTKKRGSRKDATPINNVITEQISDNLSTLENGLSTDNKKLSTLKNYKVNKREVRQRLLGYMNTMNGKKELYFWTVTFPPTIEDSTAHRLLNIWFTSLRQQKMLRNYLWVAERQENGTVHFHIAIPHKMPVQRANAMMRGTLKNEIRKGRLDYSIHKAARYNGVDIAKNRNTGKVTNFAVKKGSKALVGYLTKYITKNDAVFSHLAWHNSRGFSSIFTGVTFSVPEFSKYGFSYNVKGYIPIFRMGRKMSEEEFANMVSAFGGFTNEYFTFLPWLNDPPALIIDHLYHVNSYLQEQLN